MNDVFVDYPGMWVVLDGPNKMIGRIVNQDSVHLDQEIELQPAFEYISGLVETDHGIGRQVLLNPYDLCVSFSTPVHIKANYFNHYVKFDEMDSVDRREYQRVVEKGVALAVEARARKSGISLTNQMPQNNSPLIFK